MTNTPFHRTNLNLYAEDVEFMQRMFGRGWTEQVRDIIHQELKAIKERTKHIPNENTAYLSMEAWRRFNRGK